MPQVDSAAYAQPSAEIQRFMVGVQKHCVKATNAVTQANLERAKQQISEALQRRSEQGVRKPLDDHQIIHAPQSRKIQEFVVKMGLQQDTPNSHIDLAGRITTTTTG